MAWRTPEQAQRLKGRSDKIEPNGHGLYLVVSPGRAAYDVEEREPDPWAEQRAVDARAQNARARAMLEEQRRNYVTAGEPRPETPKEARERRKQEAADRRQVKKALGPVPGEPKKIMGLLPFVRRVAA